MAVYGTLRFPDDVVAQIEASFRAPRRQYLEVVGEGGVLRAFAPWRVDWAGEVVLEREGGSTEVVPVEQANSYTQQLETSLPRSRARRPPSRAGGCRCAGAGDRGAVSRAELGRPSTSDQEGALAAVSEARPQEAQEVAAGHGGDVALQPRASRPATSAG